MKYYLLTAALLCASSALATNPLSVEFVDANGSPIVNRAIDTSTVLTFTESGVKLADVDVPYEQLAYLHFTGEGSGIEDILTDDTVDENAPVEWFDLMGRRVPQPDGHGIYLKRQGGKTTKVAI